MASENEITCTLFYNQPNCMPFHINVSCDHVHCFAKSGSIMLLHFLKSSAWSGSGIPLTKKKGVPYTPLEQPYCKIIAFDYTSKISGQELSRKVLQASDTSYIYGPRTSCMRTLKEIRAAESVRESLKPAKNAECMFFPTATTASLDIWSTTSALDTL